MSSGVDRQKLRDKHPNMMICNDYLKMCVLARGLLFDLINIG